MKRDDRDRLHAERGAWIAARNGYTGYRQFGNGRDAAIERFLFTWAIITDLTDWGYGDRWCYHSAVAAQAALDAWDGTDGTEPGGWHRHPDSGRRRENGDPATEEVHW